MEFLKCGQEFHQFSLSDGMICQVKPSYTLLVLKISRLIGSEASITPDSTINLDLFVESINDILKSSSKIFYMHYFPYFSKN